MKYKIINKKKRLAVTMADRVFSTLFLSSHRLKKRKAVDLEGIREILVIRTAYVGDVIMTLPVLKPLKALYRGARVSFLTCSNSAPMLENNPLVDRNLRHLPAST